MSFGEDLLESAKRRDREREEAARYRWLRETHATTLIVTMFGNGCVNKSIEDAETAIDAARGVALPPAGREN